MYYVLLRYVWKLSCTHPHPIIRAPGSHLNYQPKDQICHVLYGRRSFAYFAPETSRLDLHNLPIPQSDSESSLEIGLNCAIERKLKFRWGHMKRMESGHPWQRRKVKSLSLKMKQNKEILKMLKKCKKNKKSMFWLRNAKHLKTPKVSCNET